MEENSVNLIINDNEVLKYDRNIKLPDNQLNYLNSMDTQMDKGITVDSLLIQQPSQLQKAQFVALNMLSFLDKDQQQDAIAMFSYIVYFQEKLKQVKVINEPLSKEGDNYKIEFVFYKDLSNWEKVKFH